MGDWKSYESCTRAQLLTTCYALEDTRDRALLQLDAEKATVENQDATIRRQSLDYLTLDGHAIELQDRLREVEAERDVEKARADAAEAKVRAVEALHTHGLVDSGRGMVDVCDVCTYDETEDVPSTVGWANWPCPTGQALSRPRVSVVTPDEIAAVKAKHEGHLTACDYTPTVRFSEHCLPYRLAVEAERLAGKVAGAREREARHAAACLRECARLGLDPLQQAKAIEQSWNHIAPLFTTLAAQSGQEVTP